MTNYRRGDVVLVLFPDSNLQSAKRRPALVVQADDLQSGLKQTIVAMITSNVLRAGHKSRVEIPFNSQEAKSCGLLTDSIVMTDNLATIEITEIDRVIGHMPNMQKIDSALRATLLPKLSS